MFIITQVDCEHGLIWPVYYAIYKKPRTLTNYRVMSIGRHTAKITIGLDLEDVSCA